MGRPFVRLIRPSNSRNLRLGPSDVPGGRVSRAMGDGMEEAFFQRAIARNQGDTAARLLLGEYLEDRGEKRRALGYLFMGQIDKHPYQSYSTWEWWTLESSNPWQIRLPRELWSMLARPPAPGYPRCKEWSTRRAAETALCRALARLLAREGSVVAELGWKLTRGRRP